MLAHVELRNVLLDDPADGLRGCWPCLHVSLRREGGLAAPISEHGVQAARNAHEIQSRILADENVRRLLRQLEAQGDDDVCRLYFILAATCARFAQACRLTVGDVQLDWQRLLMPPGFKGRPGTKKNAIPIPLGPDALAVPNPILERRGRNAVDLGQASF